MAPRIRNVTKFSLLQLALHWLATTHNALFLTFIIMAAASRSQVRYIPDYTEDLKPLFVVGCHWKYSQFRRCLLNARPPSATICLWRNEQNPQTARNLSNWRSEGSTANVFNTRWQELASRVVIDSRTMLALWTAAVRVQLPLLEALHLYRKFWSSI